MTTWTNIITGVSDVEQPDIATALVNGVELDTALAAKVDVGGDASTNTVTATAGATKTLAAWAHEIEQHETGKLAIGGDASASPVTATGGTTARTLAARAAERISVKEYGAAVDGVTDDTAAVQAALNALEGTGKDLYFPAGTCITRKLVLPSYVGLVGEGGGKSVLMLKAGTNDHLLVSKTWDTNQSYVDIGNHTRNLVIDGNKANNTAGDCIVHRSYQFIFENVEVRNAPENGIRQSAVTKNGGNGANAAECVYSRCRIKDSNKRGLWFYDSGTSMIADAFILGCFIHGNGAGGFYQIDAERSAGFHVVDNQIYSGYASDVYLGNFARTMVRGNHFDLAALGASGTSSYAALALGGAVDGGAVIDGNFFFLGQTEVATCTYNLIDLQNSGAVVNVVGNTFRVTGTYTNKRAIHRSAGSAVTGRQYGNYFPGLASSELGQGYADLRNEYIGVNAAFTGLGGLARQVGGTGFSDSSVALGRFSNDTTGPFDIIAKSRGTTAGANGAVQAGDILGQRSWYGNSGSGFLEGAHVRAVMEGAGTTTSMPARLVFACTTTGATLATDWYSINSNGLLRFVPNNITIVNGSGHVGTRSYAFASLPAASSHGGTMVIVSDRSGRPAWSNGTNWIWADGTTVS